jgi:hypothetical protein
MTFKSAATTSNLNTCMYLLILSESLNTIAIFTTFLRSETPSFAENCVRFHDGSFFAHFDNERLELMPHHNRIDSRPKSKDISLRICIIPMYTRAAVFGILPR